MKTPVTMIMMIMIRYLKLWCACFYFSLSIGSGKVGKNRKEVNAIPRKRNRPNRSSPVIRRSDNAIHRINLDPVDDAIRFAITYPLDGDLSVG